MVKKGKIPPPPSDPFEFLLSTVNEVSVDTSLKENEVLAPFLEELDWIDNQEILEFVRTVLLLAPRQFWTIPSSLSNDEDIPPDELLEGGNVLHTKRVVYIVRLLAESQRLTDKETDLLISAALLHDITKGGMDDSEVVYDEMHPYSVDILVDAIRNHEQCHSSEDKSSTLFTEPSDIETILRLIRCHRGYDSVIPETIPLTTLEWLLHFADFIASHIHYIVDATSDVQFWRWFHPDTLDKIRDKIGKDIDELNGRDGSSKTT